MHERKTLAYLVMVTIEQCEETCLGSGGTLDSTEAKVVSRTLNITQIPQQLLHATRVWISASTHPNALRSYLQPKRCTFADSGQLRGLEMGEAERREVAILVREVGEAINDDRELL